MNTQLTEIKNRLPKMVIMMAGQAVESGIRAYRKAEEEASKQVNLRDSGKPYNFTLRHAYYDSVGVAASVLWRIFWSCEADCQSAIEKVAESTGSYYGYPEKRFDEFVVALGERLGGNIRVRETY